MSCCFWRWIGEHERNSPAETKKFAYICLLIVSEMCYRLPCSILGVHTRPFLRIFRIINVLSVAASLRLFLFSWYWRVCSFRNSFIYSASICAMSQPLQIAIDHDGRFGLIDEWRLFLFSFFFGSSCIRTLSCVGAMHCRCHSTNK